MPCLDRRVVERLFLILILDGPRLSSSFKIKFQDQILKAPLMRSVPFFGEYLLCNGVCLSLGLTLDPAPQMTN